MKKRFISTLMVLTVTAAVGSAPLTVFAEDYDTQISNTNSKINELKSQEEAVAAKLATINSSISTIKDEASVLQKKQSQLKSEIATLEKEVTDLGVRIAKREKVLENQARSVQVNGTATNYLDAILSAESVTDALGRITSINKMVTANKELMDQQEADKKAVETKQNDTETKLTEVNDNAFKLEQKLEELNQQQLEQAVVKNDLAARRSTEEGQKAEFEKLKVEAEKQQAAAQQVVLAAETAREQDNVQTIPNTGTIVVPTPSVAAPVPKDPTGVIATAYAQIGKPYSWGATGPSSFDCSGLVQYCFAANGVSLPRTTYLQEYAGTVISLSDLQPGDLVFWGSRGATSHVAISLGGSQYIDAPDEGLTVSVGTISSYNPPSFGVRL